MDVALGLGPFILSGLILVTELHRSLETNEWSFLLGNVVWFTVGLLMVAMGVRRLCDKYEPYRTVHRLRVRCALGAAALVVWGYIYVSQSPSDPSGALKAAAYIVLVGSAVLIFVWLLVSTV